MRFIGEAIKKISPGSYTHIEERYIRLMFEDQIFDQIQRDLNMYIRISIYSGIAHFDCDNQLRFIES